jgi:hypothetical protein
MAPQPHQLIGCRYQLPYSQLVHKGKAGRRAAKAWARRLKPTNDDLKRLRIETMARQPGGRAG